MPIYTKNDRESWPEGYKRCTACEQLLELRLFYKLAKGFRGVMAKCRSCMCDGKPSGRYYATQQDKDSWPTGYKRCCGCREVIPWEDFHKNKNGLFGVDNQCKKCRKPKSKSEYASRTSELLLWQRAKGRAKRRKMDFDIEVSDVVIPDYCPVLGVKMQRGTVEEHNNSPSLDRRDSQLGYVKGNVFVISTRANMIKNDSTLEELEAVVRYLRSGVCGI